jgi:hypothetical protein
MADRICIFAEDVQLRRCMYICTYAESSPRAHQVLYATSSYRATFGESSSRGRWPRERYAHCATRSNHTSRLTLMP